MVAIQIYDAELSALKAASRRGRVRSPEMQELVEAINSLVLETAKAVVVEPGQTPQSVRARVVYAGKAAGKKLQVAISGDRVLFALKEGRRRPGPPRRRAPIVVATETGAILDVPTMSAGIPVLFQLDGERLVAVRNEQGDVDIFLVETERQESPQ